MSQSVPFSLLKSVGMTAKVGMMWLLLVWSALQTVVGAEDSRPPNVIFFLADDLGYGELGCFGQQRIRTPHLDRLASQGVRLTQHYSGNAVCAPSRCVLMTGLHPGHAFIRDNRSVKPEGQYPIPADSVTLPALLRQQGYATGAFGKWGLGPPDSHAQPLRQGFERFFGYISQSLAHNHYPASLWDDDRRVSLDNPDFSAHQALPDGVDVNDPQSYARYAGRAYAPDLMNEQARAFVRQHRDRPFFLFVPTTIPHLALQVPDDSLAEYAASFDDAPYDGQRRYLPHPAPRAAYAAMITRMDLEVGCLMELIDELGLSENTIFIFSSDNGPAEDGLGGTDSAFFKSAGPLRGRKGWLYEGGIRVPTIVHWPRRIATGETIDFVSGFEDWLPTILDLAGCRQATPQNLDGLSIAPILLGQTQPPRPFLYREFPAHGGQQSVRLGDWKGVRQNLIPRGEQQEPSLHIELYDLATDIGETLDVSAEHPEIVAQMEALMRREHVASQEFPLPALDAP